MNGGSAPGWYPDPDDAAGLRFWDGRGWSEHRARLAAPATGPAVCSCGVAAIGRCRICTEPYCRAHISATAVDDKPFRKRWEPWTCGNCIEDGQREIRAMQLARCENVVAQMKTIPKLSRVRTPDGKHPRLVNLFHHPRKATERPPRYAEAYLIEYDGGPPEPTYRGLGLSRDGTTVFDVGLPVSGVAKDRFGPKRNLTGFIVTNEINLELLGEAALRSTKDAWFEFAARSMLRAARHIGIRPDFSIVFEPEPMAALEPGLAPSDAEMIGAPSEHMTHAELPEIHAVAEIRVVEVEHDPNATVQVQPPVERRLDPPLSPPLPLPHPQI